MGALPQSLCPGSVHDEPSIPTYQNQGQANGNAGEQNQPPQALRGDLAIHSFWRTGTEAIFDIRVTDTEAASKRNKDPDKVLRQQEEEKKRKYLNHCQQAHKHFTPLVYSVDGLEGKEATAMRKQLASKLSAKWKRKYSQVCGFIRSRLAIALVRATSQCLRGTRDPTKRYTTAEDIDWVAYQGLRLYR